MADESNHRDVNHTFAGMESDDPNPFLLAHRENAALAWRLTLNGETVWMRDFKDCEKEKEAEKDKHHEPSLLEAARP